MKDISLIHFHPLELYPPVMNMLNFLGENGFSVDVLSHETTKIPELYDHPNIRVRRLKSFEKRSVLYRQWSYLLFFIRGVLFLKKNRSKSILYYESNSALPVFFFLKTRIRNSYSLYIHYHEYNSIQQYKNNMKFVYLSYLAEKSYLWRKADWISHTNNFRKDLFKIDYPWTSGLSVLPNYPPRNWSVTKKREKSKERVKLVYVGSLGLENFYLKELCNWVRENSHLSELAIYTHNCQQDAKDYLDQLNCENITVDYKGYWYYDLPSVLSLYDVGIIMYNGFSENYIYNETNKLFEYLACGLDVWFSEETKGIYKHITTDTYPKVLKLDYNRLYEYELDQLVDRTGLQYKPASFNCESVYAKFLDQLIKNP
jgi:hypothetical protein